MTCQYQHVSVRTQLKMSRVHFKHKQQECACNLQHQHQPIIQQQCHHITQVSNVCEPNWQLWSTQRQTILLRLFHFPTSPTLSAAGYYLSILIHIKLVHTNVYTSKLTKTCIFVCGWYARVLKLRLILKNSINNWRDRNIGGGPEAHLSIRQASLFTVLPTALWVLILVLPDNMQGIIELEEVDTCKDIDVDLAMFVQVWRFKAHLTIYTLFTCLPDACNCFRQPLYLFPALWLKDRPLPLASHQVFFTEIDLGINYIVLWTALHVNVDDFGKYFACGTDYMLFAYQLLLCETWNVVFF